MEKRSFTINNNSYQILIPPVRQAMKLSERTAFLVGPLLTSLGGKGEDGMKRLSTAISGVDSVAADSLLMDAATLSKLSYNEQMICDEIDFERHFTNHKKDVFPVLIWCLWEIVKDFFPDLGAFGQILKAKFGEEMAKASSQMVG